MGRGMTELQTLDWTEIRSRPPLVTEGLGTKGTLFAGIVQWRWKMSSNAVHGRWTIDISCGTAGSLRTSFLVR